MNRLVLIIFIFAGGNAALLSQTVSRAVLSSAGGFTKNKKGCSFSFTMGEVAGQYPGSSPLATPGFQQGEKNAEKAIRQEPTAMQNTRATNAPPTAPLSVSIYPTVVSDYLNIDLPANVAEIAGVRIFSLRGEVLKHFNIQPPGNGHFQLSGLSNFPRGIYFIKIFLNGRWARAGKFIKA